MINEHDLNDWECLPMQFLNKTKPKTWFVYNNELYMLDSVLNGMAFAYDTDGKKEYFNASMAITPIKFIIRSSSTKKQGD